MKRCLVLRSLSDTGNSTTHLLGLLMDDRGDRSGTPLDELAYAIGGTDDDSRSSLLFGSRRSDAVIVRRGWVSHRAAITSRHRPRAATAGTCSCVFLLLVRSDIDWQGTVAPPALVFARVAGVSRPFKRLNAASRQSITITVTGIMTQSPTTSVTRPSKIKIRNSTLVWPHLWDDP